MMAQKCAEENKPSVSAAGSSTSNSRGDSSWSGQGKHTAHSLLESLCSALMVRSSHMQSRTAHQALPEKGSES